MLFIPINTINFSNIKNIFKEEKKLNTTQSLEGPQVKLKTENIVIEVNQDINVKNDTFFKIYQILPYAWISVFLFLIIYNFICYFIFLYKLKKSYLDLQNQDLEDLIDTICKEMHLKKVNFKISDIVSTPMTIGILNKKIIIPKEVLNNEQYEMILRHELFHIKNKDIEYKFLLLVLNCIYWFNPIIYMFANQVNEILELNCDEKVLENQTHKYRISYAQTLLNQIEISKNKQFKYSINFANRRKNIMKRFSNIIDGGETKKCNIATIATVTAVLLIVSILLIVLIPNINFATSDTLKPEITLEPKDSNNIKSENVLKPEDSNASESESNDIILEKVEASTPSFIAPLKNYEISKKFNIDSTYDHTGIDLKATSNSEIYSVSSGKVVYSKYCGSYGNLIIVQHENGLQTFYAHCSKLLKNVDDTVNQGDVIALVGSTGYSTGPHLHFEIRDSEKKPLNPELYINF